jgi:hypothetical protein
MDEYGDDGRDLDDTGDEWEPFSVDLGANADRIAIVRALRRAGLPESGHGAMIFTKFYTRRPRSPIPPKELAEEIALKLKLDPVSAADIAARFWREIRR